MGIQDKGAFGGFRNKTGALVGRILKGQNVITAMPVKSKKAATQKQIDQRMRFGLVTHFLAWLRNLVVPGFQDREQRQSPMNKAVQYNLRYAVTGTSPQFSIDYPRVVFSQGKCPLPANLSAQALTGGKIGFSWGLSNLGNYGQPTDQVNLVVYSLQKAQFVVLEKAATRQEGSFDMQLPVEYTGDEVYCYLNFVSADGKVVSNSAYIAQVTIL